MNELLVNFIEQALKNGEIPTQIKKTLILRGTSAEEIDKAFEAVNERENKQEGTQVASPQEVVPQPVPTPEVTPQAVPTSPAPIAPVPAPAETKRIEVPVGSGVKEDWGSDGVQKPKVVSPMISVPNAKQPRQPQTQMSPPSVLPQASQEGGPSGRLKYVEPKKSKKGLLLLFLVIFVPLLVASAGGYYYYFYIMQSPDKIVNKMISEMQNVSTYHQKMDMSISFKMDAGMAEEGISKFKSKSNSLVGAVILSQLDLEENEAETIDDTIVMGKCVAEDGTIIDCDPVGSPEVPAPPILENVNIDTVINVGLEGDSDVTDKANPKSSYTLTMSLPFLESQLSFDVTTIGSTQYYRIKNIPADVSSFLPADLSPLENKWIKLDIKSLIEQEELLGIDAGSEVSNEINKIKEEFSEEKMVDKIAELQVLLSNSEMVEVTEDFGTEKIDGGVSAYHYGFRVGEENIKQFIKSAFSIIYGGIMDDVMTVQELTESLGEIKLEGELWIGKKDYLLYKADVNMSTIIKDEMFGVTTDYNVSLSMSDFNVPVNINEPADYVDVVDLITEIFNDVDETSSLSGDAFNIQSLAKLKGKLSAYYGMHGSYPNVSSVADLVSELTSADIALVEFGKTDTNSFYCYRKAGQHYVLGTTLDFSGGFSPEPGVTLEEDALIGDLDGVYLCGETTKDCADPVYCVGP